MDREAAEISFRKTVDTYGDMVYRLAVLYLKNRADAEDQVQETFLTLLRKQPQFQSSEHLRAWLMTVTANGCKNQLRSPWKRLTAVREDISHFTDSNCQSDADDRLDVVQAVLRLPVKYRSVIYLYYYEGYSTHQTAKILSRSEGAVRTQLRRGRELLRSMLEGFDDGTK